MHDAKVEIGHTKNTNTPFIAVTLNGGTHAFVTLGQTAEECLKLKLPGLDAEILNLKARLGELTARRDAVAIGLQYLKSRENDEN